MRTQPTAADRVALPPWAQMTRSHNGPEPWAWTGSIGWHSTVVVPGGAQPRAHFHTTALSVDSWREGYAKRMRQVDARGPLRFRSICVHPTPLRWRAMAMSEPSPETDARSHESVSCGDQLPAQDPCQFVVCSIRGSFTKHAHLLQCLELL
jgi:hypothetical protein